MATNPATLPHAAASAAVLSLIPTPALETTIEVLIALRDARDGDPDLEPNGDELDGQLSEDDAYFGPLNGDWRGCGAGDDVDAEDDDPREEDDPSGDPLDDGEMDEAPYCRPPVYGIDQTKPLCSGHRP